MGITDVAISPNQIMLGVGILSFRLDWLFTRALSGPGANLFLVKTRLDGAFKLLIDSNSKIYENLLVWICMSQICFKSSFCSLGSKIIIIILIQSSRTWGSNMSKGKATKKKPTTAPGLISWSWSFLVPRCSYVRLRVWFTLCSPPLCCPVHSRSF